MSQSILSQPYFHNEEAAYEFVESHIWRRGPVCPHCGGVERNSKMGGKSTRIGTYKCYDCRKPFTVKIGTIFESSHIPLRLWLQAIFLIASSKKGISSNQLHRTLGITLKSAWFMSHRIREAMNIRPTRKLGGGGKVVEADETFWGSIPVEHQGKRGSWHHKQKIFALVERGGEVRSFRVKNVTAETLKPIMQANIAKDTRLHTDEGGQYRKIKKDEFLSHETVVHLMGEYARGDVHINTAEGYFSLLKRGLTGTFHHVSEQHLQRYVNEFNFRYNHRKALGIEDSARAECLLRGVVGKRLTYQTTNQKGTSPE
jgi:transposase-like protein